MVAADENEKEPRAGVPIEFVIPEGMPLNISDFVVAQNSTSNGLFYLTFFQTQPPINQADYEPPEKLKAQCVARIALTAGSIQSLIGLLQKNFDKFARHIQSELDEHQRTSEPES